jgi:hypothetical protein
MAVCAFDFIIAPVLWSMTQAFYKIVPFVQWQPLTLQGAGLFNLAMGAVLGIAAYGRTKEKMAGAENGGIHTGPDLSAGFGHGAGTTYVPPGQGQVNVSNQPMGGGFNSGYGSPAMGGAPAFGVPAARPTPVSSFGAPVQPPHPEI